MSKKLRVARLPALLIFFCVVLLCKGDNDCETVVIFKGNSGPLQYTDDIGIATSSTPRAFVSPAFVAGEYNNKEFLAVISGGHFSEDWTPGGYIEGVARTSYGNYTQWTAAKIFTNVSKTSNTNKLWGDITAVMKGDKIYVLATSIVKEEDQDENTIFFSAVRDPFIIVGSISNCTISNNNGDNVFVKWDAAKSIKHTLPSTVHGTQEYRFIGGEGNGITTTNGTIMFPIVMVKNHQEIMASILYSHDNGSTWHIGGETEQNTGVGSLVECSDGKLLFSVASEDGYSKVFESNDMGRKWQRSLLFFGVWGNDINRHSYKSQGSVINVPVDNKDVFLFSHPLNKQDNDNPNTLQLWMSDGQRIMRVGTISDEKKEFQTGHSILAYVNKHLYVTHEINPFVSSRHDRTGQNNQWEKVIGLTPLTEFFETIASTVRDWQDIDNFFNKSGIPTKSLVGVLGNTTEGKAVWTDMYNCVNATVKGGEPVDGGFRFDGKPGSGAKWPVASQGQNRNYMFTEKEFTLTATVTMHATNVSGDVLILGASAFDYGNDVPIGIGYTTEKKWFALQNNNNKTETKFPVMEETKYQVAITFANKTGSVYLDGEEIASTEISLSQKDPISHFFIGEREMHPVKKSAPCTVKNVMLFSRALNKEEIVQVTKVKESNKTYKKKIKEKPVTATEKNESNENSKPTVTQESQEVVLNTTSTITPAKRLPVIKTESTITPDNSLPVTKTELTSTQENVKFMKISEPQKAQGFSSKTITSAKANDKKHINVLTQYQNTAFLKDVEGDKSAAVSFSAVAWLCVACSLIALMEV